MTESIIKPIYTNQTKARLWKQQTLDSRLPPRSRCTNGITNGLAGSLRFLDSEIEFEFSGLVEVVDDSVISSCLDQLIISSIK